VKNVPGLVRRRAEEAAMLLRPTEVSQDLPTPPAMPQTIDAPAPVSATMKSSRTIFGLLIGGAGAFLSWSKDVVLEAANQVSLLAPAKEIASGLGLNAATVLFGLTIAGLAIALVARLDDARTGANAK
jgi:hypothetical protein